MLIWMVDWEQVWRGMQRYNLGNCTTAVKFAVDHIDKQLAHPITSAALKIKWFGRTAQKNSNAGFADTLHFPRHLPRPHFLLPPPKPLRPHLRILQRTLRIQPPKILRWRLILHWSWITLPIIPMFPDHAQRAKLPQVLIKKRRVTCKMSDIPIGAI